MLKRIITGSIMLAILIPLIAAPKNHFAWLWFEYVGIILAMGASYEMMNMFYKKSPALKIYRFVVPIFSGILVYMVYLSTAKGLVFNEVLETFELWRRLLKHFWLVIYFLIEIAILLIMLIFTKHSTAHDMLASVFTLVYCGLIMGYVIAIKYIEPMTQEQVFINAWGGRSFGYLYTIVCLTDVFAYLVGRKFGKRKLCPEISPKKTVEGAIGGLVFGSIIGTACIFLYKLVDVETLSKSEIWFVIIGGFFVSLIISFCVQIGDLIASKLKRSYEIKDFGKIFPGHGGILDRFDSLIFSGLVYYIIIHFIQLMIIGVKVTETL